MSIERLESSLPTGTASCATLLCKYSQCFKGPELQSATLFRSLNVGTLLFYPEPATDGLSHHNIQLVLQGTHKINFQ
jgi:hypothetical protein